MFFVQEVAQGEGNGPTKAPVGDDELVLGRELHDSELVDEPCEAQYTCRVGKKQAQDQGKWEDPGSVPVGVSSPTTTK